jgi:hypothetical protein
MTRIARSERVLEEYDRAPRLMLVFPSSGQTWQLRLTGGLARQIAAEVAPLVRLHRSARRLRRRARVSTRRRPILLHQ